MMQKRYVFPLAQRIIPWRGGSKARNLQFLIRQKLPVPPGWIVSWDAEADFHLKGASVITAISSQLCGLVRDDQVYAVRSSASVEDSGQTSCAGQFCSVLHVRGIQAILDSIQTVWQSAQSAAFIAYRQRHLFGAHPVRMAVIVQEQVQAVTSGVTFSKNPMTGLSETIIEANPGLSDGLESARKDPERWISKWGNWIQKPESGLLGEATARDLVLKTSAIAKSYGQPVDLEWAYDGQILYFLQVRPITHLDIPIYSNRIAREMLPGIILPLVWSVNTRLINQVWADILIRMTGDRTIRADELASHFYYRAYFNMAVFGRIFERLGMPYEALELLLGLEQDGPDKPHMRPGAGVMSRMHRLLAFAASILMLERRFKRIVNERWQRYRILTGQMRSDWSAQEWLDMAVRIFNETQPVAYYNIMMPMQAMMYHRLLTSQLKKHGIDARMLELEGAAAAREINNPHTSLNRLRRQYSGCLERLSDDEELRLQEDVSRFLERFGHFSDSGNDFSKKPWRETPDLIRNMILQTAGGEEQSTAGTRLLRFDELKLPQKKGMIRLVYRRASRFAVHREVVSSLYTYGYGQFRTCFIRIGDLLVQSGVLERTEDVFYLYWDELADLIRQAERTPQHDLIGKRRHDIERVSNVNVPDLIFGSDQPPFQDDYPIAFKGIPTSLGTYTGPARVLQALSEFERLNQGDILVIPYSDVGWTPLFARAGAVIAESGGVLSHSSIIAREYGIPAVVSVKGACRISDGTWLTVNGYTGEITLSQS